MSSNKKDGESGIAKAIDRRKFLTTAGATAAMMAAPRWARGEGFSGFQKWAGNGLFTVSRAKRPCSHSRAN